MNWYDDSADAPIGTLWWAVEHLGHPAFYLRALMPGDFRPGQAGPLPRHTYGLDGKQLKVVRCETCHEAPRPEDLAPIERKTHGRGFLDAVRNGGGRWPPPTKATSCWNCSNVHAPADREVDGHLVCAACAAHLKAHPDGGKPATTPNGGGKPATTPNGRAEGKN